MRWLVLALLFVAAPAYAISIQHQTITADVAIGNSTANTETRMDHCDLHCDQAFGTACVWALRQYSSVATGSIVSGQQYYFGGAYRFEWTPRTGAGSLDPVFSNGAYFDALTGTVTGNCTSYK